MAGMTIQDLSEAMRDIDFGMLSTRTEDGAFASRPMSNNRQVEYDGASWFFAYDSARSVADIARDPQVGLTFTGKAGLLGKPPIFIAVQGKAALIRDKAQFAEHWNPDLERWFEQGVDTPGLILIRIDAGRVHYWNGEDEGEVRP
jgi:general stress protein 26